MKKIEVLVILIVFLAINLNNVHSEITGETVTGDSTQSVGFNITIISGLNITIEKPKNHTYFSNESLEIKIESNGQNVWYNLDHGSNITLAENNNVFKSFFNTTSGGHALYAFSNDSAGNTAQENVNFTINLTAYTINNSKFSGSKKGSSTNFNQYSILELENLSGIMFEHTSYGLMNFTLYINVTNDVDTTDNTVNFSEYINISFNLIELNATALPNFNTTATLYLYGLSFTDPRILQDGNLCPSSVCKINSYSSGTLSFNVSHFAAYSAEETPAEVSTSPSASSSGGGGGGGIPTSPTPASKANIEVIPGSLSINVVFNQEDIREIVIVNNGDKTIVLASDVQGLIGIEMPETIILEAGETKIIEVKIKPIEKGLLVGKIIFRVSGKIIKEIPVIINVRSKDFLFDFSIFIQKELRSLKMGKPLRAQVNILPLGQAEPVNVLLTYIIKDYSGNIYLEEEENILISEQKEFIKEFSTSGIPAGRYVLGLELDYGAEFATASAEFEIVSGFEKSIVLIIVIAIIILIIAFVIAFILIGRKPKTKKR